LENFVGADAERSNPRYGVDKKKNPAFAGFCGQLTQSARTSDRALVEIKKALKVQDFLGADAERSNPRYGVDEKKNPVFAGFSRQLTRSAQTPTTSV
jgi:2-hydroxychromene-2-carboxylate isomerase